MASLVHLNIRSHATRCFVVLFTLRTIVLGNPTSGENLHVAIKTNDANNYSEFFESPASDYVGFVL